MIIKSNTSCLIISNVQQELVTILHQGQKLIDDCCWLIEVAKALNVPVVILEHKGLGPTVDSIKKLTKQDHYIEMVRFSCLEDKNCMSIFNELKKEQYIFAGTEPHITIMQTASHFVEAGKKVFVVANSVSSRNNEDIQLAFPRLRKIGVELVSKEMVFFEWIEYSENPKYLDLSRKFLDGRYIRL